MRIYEIIEDLNKENGSNYKMEVLKQHKDNDLLKDVLKLTYDRVKYLYGVTINQLEFPKSHPIESSLSLDSALLYLEEDIVSGNLTGHAARDRLQAILDTLEYGDAQVFWGIIRRDLRINMGRTNINKVFKNLITKPIYMRCGLCNEKTLKKISFPAYTQLKADGTYREFHVDDGVVKSYSRTGIEYDYPIIFDQMKSFPSGVYVGELTVVDCNGPLDRATGNGLINSDDPPHDSIIVDLWDYITFDEYSNAGNKVKNTTPYFSRLDKLHNTLEDRHDDLFHVYLIKTKVVDNILEAYDYCSLWMTNGYEGAILKDFDGVFRDGTSAHQLKLKLEIDAEVRITGFVEGRAGTKREKTFGAIAYETDDGKVKGQTSGFTDAQLEDFNSRREEMIGMIMTVTFNDVTRARHSDYYALSHPRFTEIRNDKDETDTLERILESKQMAMEMKK